PCAAGEHGELVISGGMNSFLPLLRYRTNDYARLVFRGHLPMIINLQGRPPTVFRASDGTMLNNLDVSNALAPLALPQFTLHQAADGSLDVRVRDTGVDTAQVRKVLAALFGESQPMNIASVDALGDKVIQYTS